MAEKVITKQDLTKTYGPRCIPVVFVKNCLLEISQVSEGALFFKLLEDLIGGPCIQECQESSTGKNYHTFSVLSAVSNVFEKHVNNRLVDHLERCDLFYDFQYGFKPSLSFADHLTVVSDRIAWDFNISGAT